MGLQNLPGSLLIKLCVIWFVPFGMLCNQSKCKELIFRKRGYNENMTPVHNIPQCTELPILGVTFQENCRYSVHVRSKLIKANRCLFILRSLRKEGLQQEELDHLFNSIVLPNFTYGLSRIWCHRFGPYMYNNTNIS